MKRVTRFKSKGNYRRVRLDQAMQALFEAHLGWAERVARKVGRGLPPSFDLKDLQQIARLEHWHQVQRYDPARGVPYQAFAYRAVHGAVQMACRRRNYQDATAEELKGQQQDGRMGPEEALLERERWRNSAGPKDLRRRSKIYAGMRILEPVDAYLVRRVYLDGEDLEALERVWGLRLARRLALAVRRLRRAVGRPGSRSR